MYWDKVAKFYDVFEGISKMVYEECGYQDLTYDVVEGRMPCAVAVIGVPQTQECL